MKYLLIVCMAVALLVTPAFASDSVTEVLAPVVTVVDVNPDVSDRTSFLESVMEIFGEYSPRTQTVTTYLPDGSAVSSVEIIPGLAGLDWMWLSCVGLFALFLFCLMRFLGGATK